MITAMDLKFPKLHADSLIVLFKLTKSGRNRELRIDFFDIKYINSYSSKIVLPLTQLLSGDFNSLSFTVQSLVRPILKYLIGASVPDGDQVLDSLVATHSRQL